MQGDIVTGAGGFVGRSLRPLLGPTAHALGFAAPDWERALLEAPLAGATIYHLAARVHVPRERDVDAFERDNVGKTRRLAEEAARQGARRIVFLSTAKVYGEESPPGRAFGVTDAPAPADAYARSKLAAERVLAEIAAPAGVEVVTVRSPLVLGAGARGNLEELMRFADSPWPLPFGAVGNRRSVVFVEDLARLLEACGRRDEAAGRTFVAAHPTPVSTASLAAALRRALGRPERLVALPPRWLELAAMLAGQGARVRRLTRSLEVDPTEAKQVLGWSASVDLDAACESMARAWRRGWR